MNRSTSSQLYAEPAADERGEAVPFRTAAQPDPAKKKTGFAEEALPHLKAVHRFALRLTRGNEAEAEDLVQDTYLRAYRGWDTYSRGTKCCSWLFTICRNVAIRKSEGKRNLEIAATTLGIADVGSLVAAREGAEGLDDPEQAFFEEMVDDEVWRAIDGLPREYREAVVLYDLEGLGYRDIAKRLGVADGTIKSRIHRGRKLLYDVLYPYAVEVGHLRTG